MAPLSFNKQSVLAVGGLCGAAFLVFGFGLWFWDEPIRTPDAILEGHRGWIQALAFAPDGSTLASAGGAYGIAGETILWDVAGQTKRSLAGLADLVTCMAFSADGKNLATASYDKTITLWEPATGRKRETFLGHAYPASSVAFSPDGSMLVSASFLEEVVRVWDVSSGRELWAFPGTAPVTWSPQGQTIAACSDHHQVTLWDVTSRTMRDSLPGQTGAIVALAISTDGRMLATTASDFGVCLWDVASCQLQSTLKGHEGPVFSVAFSPDGVSLASGSQDRSVKLWNTATGQEQATFPGHPGPVNAVVFSPDGKIVASSSSGKTVWLWKVNNAR